MGLHSKYYDNGIRITITSQTSTFDGGQKTKSDTIIHDKIPVYIINSSSAKFNRDLALMTNTNNIIALVGAKKQGIKIGMKVEITYKANSGFSGPFAINDIIPKQERGRVVGYYLILEKYAK